MAALDEWIAERRRTREKARAVKAQRERADDLAVVQQATAQRDVVVARVRTWPYRRRRHLLTGAPGGVWLVNTRHGDSPQATPIALNEFGPSSPGSATWIAGTVTVTGAVDELHEVARAAGSPRQVVIPLTPRALRWTGVLVIPAVVTGGYLVPAASIAAYFALYRMIERRTSTALVLHEGRWQLWRRVPGHDHLTEMLSEDARPDGSVEGISGSPVIQVDGRIYTTPEDAPRLFWRAMDAKSRTTQPQKRV